MQYDDDTPYGRPEETRPISWEEPRQAPGMGIAVGAVVAVVVVAGIAFWLWRGRQPPAPPAAGAGPAPVAAEAATPTATAPTRMLPALAASDALVRELAATLSRHPQLAAWLASDELVRRFVASVVNVAEGTSPRRHLDFLRPSEPFRARRSGGRWFVDPASYRRYDLLTEVFVSLDAAAAARLYAEIHPLLDQAYGEIGNPTSTFDATLGRAVANLLAVPVPEGTPELIEQTSSFHWADHRLEESPTAEKHLMRLGPANARRVKEKLRALVEATAIPLG